MANKNTKDVTEDVDQLETDTEKETKKPKDFLPKRKKPREKKLVTFELESYEGTFEAPDLNTIPVKVQRKLMSGDLTPLVETLGEYGDVVDDMNNDDISEFLEAWSEASGISLGN